MSGAPDGPRWQPTANVSTARIRADMLAAARRFFSQHGVLEVETPVLSRAAVSDPNIESISAALSADATHAYYLQTSPEFAMKRLLCAGWPDIFQVCKVFRDGEIGARHQPEFTLVEWYRRDIEFTAMMAHTVAFIHELLGWHATARQVEYLSYRDAFWKFAQLDPLTASTAELRRASAADEQLARTLGDAREPWLDLVLSTRVAPRFSAQELTVLHHYPASQAALARLCPADSAVADRFEIFCGDLELANGYFELGDAAEQERRCAADQQQRARQNATLRPIDEAFLQALRAGLPACCGVAVGFDRLVMLRTQANKLSDVQTFPTVDLAND